MSTIPTTIRAERPSTSDDSYNRYLPLNHPHDGAVKLGIIAFAALAALAAWQADVAMQAVDILWASAAGRVFLAIGMPYGALLTVWSFWRLYLALRYRPVATVADSRLPSITVVVPAYNEGKLVYQTLKNIATANYPRHLFEIYVVDDGSVDDTWRHIQRATREFGNRITALRFRKNRGKRHALYEGFRRATGDILISIDSDSLIEKDALRAVVSPLVEDASVGAAAGNVRVLNRAQGFVPRMLSVRYVMTFDYKRAAQSMMGGGAVLCCAGALAAYRRSAVMPVLEQWLHQTWRGLPARAGEDHAMTNFILRQGMKVRYQRTARVLTNSPTSYLGLCKMFLRWARSNIRETFFTGSYVFGEFRRESKLGIRFNFLMGAVGQILPYMFLIVALALAVAMPGIFGLKLIGSCAVGSLFTVLFFAIRERSTEAAYGVLYGMYATFGLFWVHPYALMTCQKSVWLTRNKKRSEHTQPQLAGSRRNGRQPRLALAMK